MKVGRENRSPEDREGANYGHYYRQIKIQAKSVTQKRLSCKLYLPSNSKDELPYKPRQDTLDFSHLR